MTAQEFLIRKRAIFTLLISARLRLWPVASKSVNFPAGITATISINGVPTIVNYNGQADSQTININKGDLINVKMSASSMANFGMDFITRMGGNGKIVSWYNNNLASQMLIPSVYFTSPLSGTTIYKGVDVPIVLKSYPVARTFRVTFTYNEGGSTITSSQWIDSNSGTTQLFPIPTAMDASSYRFSVKYLSPLSSDGIYLGLNTVSGSIKTNTPSTISFDAASLASSYSAGASVPLTVPSSPNASSGAYMVSLTCGSLAPVYGVINSNSIGENFFIDDYMYGNSCVFNINYPIASTNHPSITVTQPVSFTEPSNSNSYYADEPVRVLPSATASIPDATITVSQDCGGTITTYPGVAVNQPFSASPPAGFTGSCTYSSAQSGLYNAASPTVTITIESKADLIFILTPAVIANGKDFAVQIDSVGTASQPTVNLIITCDNVGLVQEWTGVTLNQPVRLNLNAPNLSNGPLNCNLVASSPAYNEQTSPVVIVLIPLNPLEWLAFSRKNGFAHWSLDRENVVRI